MKPVLVFQSDFTCKESAVCAMYGVVKSVDPELQIFTNTHEIPPFDIWSASYRLFQPMAFWPQGTIFVSVVDPGVGTNRKACVAKTSHGYYVVTPDNGTLTHISQMAGISEVREIDPEINRLPSKSTSTVEVFHGRDLFSYCAARLAGGIICYEEVGPAYPVEEIILLPTLRPEVKRGKVQGILEIADPNFGNMWTNIPLEAFLQAGFCYGDKVRVKIRYQGQTVFGGKTSFENTFGQVKTGEAVIYNNELNRLGMAINQGNLQQKYQLGYGVDWQVTLTRLNQ